MNFNFIITLITLSFLLGINVMLLVNNLNKNKFISCNIYNDFNIFNIYYIYNRFSNKNKLGENYE